MTAEQLKASVLQMAIEGKLVPQLVSEPAAEIEGEEPENVPFVIPDKWKWVRIGKVFTLQAGKFISASEIQSEGMYPCYGGNGVRGYVSHYNRNGHFPIIGRQGALCGNINMAEGEFYATEHAIVVDCHDFGDPACVGFFLKAMNLNQYATATAQPGLAVRNINKLLFPLPPLEEQHRIVARINELLPLIEQYGNAQTSLDSLEKDLPDKLRASVLQKAIQGKLVPQLESEPVVNIDVEEPEDIPFAVPDKWKWVKISDYADVNPRITEDDETEVSFVPMALLTEGYGNHINVSQVKKWKDVKKGFTRFCNGDIVLAKITPCFENRKSAIVVNACNGKGAGTTELHVIRCKEKIIPEYLLYFFKTSYFIQYGVEHFRGTAGQQRLGTTDLKKCLVPLPPLEEQRRIVARLKEILPHIDTMANVK